MPTFPRLHTRLSARRRTRPGVLAATATATALIGALVVGPPAGSEPAGPDRAADPAGAEKIDRSPTPVARRAGVTKAEGGYLGWRTSGDTEVGIRHGEQPLVGVVYGIDVSGHQNSVDWTYWWGQGKRFAYVKATEGNYYKNEDFTQQYNGSYRQGFIRGSYHFANPTSSSGAAQAEYFVARGGGWSRDGKTLPGVLDIEYNPYGSTCYGLSQASMVSWISSFTSRYKQLTGRDAVIYTNLDWWSRCTGNSTRFNQTNPLWVARYASSPGTLPGGWGFNTFWQYSDSPIDLDRFNGAYDRLVALANG